MGELTSEGREWEGEGGEGARLGAPWGGVAWCGGGGAWPMAARFGPTAAMRAVCMRKKTRRKGKRRDRKEKKMGREKRK
jgi:hypothetical protein